MKKLLLVFILLLSGCTTTTNADYYLYVYYASTCPICSSFINTVVPQIEEIYGDSMEVTLMDIDEDESVEAYAKTCTLLQDYELDDSSGSVPFIVLDGYFAKIGYEVGQAKLILDAIDNAINNDELPTELGDVYYFKEGRTYHEEGGK
ncbi:MAG: hypothetical protein LUF02_07555 [Erysipelotrichaceae bacterium]|nr:hypothetical protein [Erysipelotrichaceae bacterium]